MPGSPPTPRTSPCTEGEAEDLRPEEEDARRLLAPILDADLIHLDPPWPDLVICQGGSVVGGIEVTMTMSGDLEEIAMAMGRHGSGFDAPELAGSWLLIVESTANISRLLAERSFITEMVAGFEGAGFEGAGFEGAGFEGAGVTKLSGADMPEEAGELGIISGRRRTGASPPHRIGFWAAPQGWSFGSASVVDEVVAAAVDDKGDQLARVIDETPITAEELHLFVWVMPELIDAFDTLRRPPPPALPPPELSPGIGKVWVAPCAPVDDAHLWSRGRGDPAWTGTGIVWPEEWQPGSS